MAQIRLDGRKTPAQRVESLLALNGGTLKPDKWLQLIRESPGEGEGLATLEREGRAFINRDDNGKPVLIGLTKL